MFFLVCLFRAVVGASLVPNSVHYYFNLPHWMRVWHISPNVLIFDATLYIFPKHVKLGSSSETKSQVTIAYVNVDVNHLVYSWWWILYTDLYIILFCFVHFTCHRRCCIVIFVFVTLHCKFSIHLLALINRRRPCVTMERMPNLIIMGNI